MKSLERIEGSLPNVLKRGARYFSISTKRFRFGDTLNYTSPCKLSKYLQQWKVEEVKSIFPYQRYSSIEGQCYIKLSLKSTIIYVVYLNLLTL